MPRALSVRFNRGMVQIFVAFGLAILLRGAAQFAVKKYCNYPGHRLK